MSTLQLYDINSRPIILEKQIGSGGEGAVYSIKGESNSVAKIYHQPVSPQKEAKLSGMVACANPQLTGIAAWPTQTLSAVPRGPLCGIVMPKVSSHKEIHHLYGPAHRKRDFPKADWAFLIQAARNIASAFRVIHAHGHVVGDVNQSGIFISDQATCRLIDCDSFQVKMGSEIYFCEVGVPQFTPPELQGSPFRGILRTPNHDNFGLALLCFHLLFMGRHPFAGRFSGTGDMPIEKAISEFRFAFGNGATAKLMAPPPSSLPFTSVSPVVAQLFERAFSKEAAERGNRPQAGEWVQTLEEFQRGLLTCQRDSIHKYYRGFGSCPWCQMEQINALFFFLTTVTIPVGSTFDLKAIWSRIEAIQLPTKSSAPIVPTTATPIPLPPHLQGYKQRKAIKEGALNLASVVAGVGIILWMISAGIEGTIIFWAIVGFLFGIPWVRSRISSEEDMEEKRKRNDALSSAQKAWDSAIDYWQKASAEQPFNSQFQELKKMHDEYNNLDVDKQRESSTYLLHSFLEQQIIEPGKIQGLGVQRIATLAAWGIETAADVIRSRVQAIPGFGPTRTSALIAWRANLEAKFRSNPQQWNRASLAGLEQKYARRRQDLERALSEGPSRLEQLKLQATQQQTVALTHLRQLASDLAQAKADMSVF
jgi:DNA-binding helix-hairpin-helix protein with protein kinase domain